MEKKHILPLMMLCILLVSSFIPYVHASSDKITLDYFYSGECQQCLTKKGIIELLEKEDKYSDYVDFNYKDYQGDPAAEEEYNELYLKGFQENFSYPLSFVVIKYDGNQTMIIDNITYDHIAGVLDGYVAMLSPIKESTGFDPIVIFGSVGVIVLILIVVGIIFMRKKKEL
jgi:hypothetical protein